MKLKIALKTCACAAVGFAVFAGLTAAPSASAKAAESAKFTVSGNKIEKSLTGKPGNAAKGLRLAIGRKKGNCLACHKMPVPSQLFHGEVGPDLRGVADRYSVAEMRLRLVDSKRINPATSMPAFYRSTGLHRLQKKWVGKTVLKAQEVEDILAYVMTLSAKRSFKDTFRLNYKAGVKTFEWRGKLYAAKKKSMKK